MVYGNRPVVLRQGNGNGHIHEQTEPCRRIRSVVQRRAQRRLRRRDGTDTLFLQFTLKGELEA